MNNGKYVKGKDFIGAEYTSKKGFPKGNAHTSEGQNITVGEKFKILDYDEKSGEYTLLNLNLGVPQAWFKVNQLELDYILRQGDVK